MIIKTYSELSKLKTFEDRYNYLKLDSNVGKETFGFDRFINQRFYKSNEWRRIRDLIIVRDNGCDLGIKEREIFGTIIIHHMNPLFINDIVDKTDFLLNPEYLISTSFDTHNFIHYGKEDSRIEKNNFERSKYDTCPWKQYNTKEKK